MWKDFEITNVQNYENVKNLENQALFPNDKFKKDSLKKSSNSPYDSNQKTEKLRYNDSGGYFV